MSVTGTPACARSPASHAASGAAGLRLARPVGVRYQQPAEADHVAGAGGGAEPRMERQEGPGRVVLVRQMGIEIGTERPLAEGEIVERLPADTILAKPPLPAEMPAGA